MGRPSFAWNSRARNWLRGWQFFLSWRTFRKYMTLVPRAWVTDIALQDLPAARQVHEMIVGELDGEKSEEEGADNRDSRANHQRATTHLPAICAWR